MIQRIPAQSPSWVKGANNTWLVKFYGEVPPPLGHGVTVAAKDGRKDIATVLEVSSPLGGKKEEPYFLLFTDKSVGIETRTTWKGFVKNESKREESKRESLPVQDSKNLILEYVRENPNRTIREIFHETNTGCANFRELNSRIHQMERDGFLEGQELDGTLSQLVEERGGKIVWSVRDSRELREARLTAALESTLKAYPDFTSVSAVRNSEGKWVFSF